MKTVQELRSNKLHDSKGTLTLGLKYVADEYKVDFDVYLPSKNMNLQRGFVWTKEQKTDLIMSIILERYIPNISIICVYDDTNDEEIYQIIDGKQRLSTMLGFYENEFTINVEGSEYYYKDLPVDYQNVIRRYHIHTFIIYENYGSVISDDEKIEWFKMINYNQTPQDVKHLNKLYETHI